MQVQEATVVGPDGVIAERAKKNHFLDGGGGAHAVTGEDFVDKASGVYSGRSPNDLDGNVREIPDEYARRNDVNDAYRAWIDGGGRRGDILRDGEHHAA